MRREWPARSVVEKLGHKGESVARCNWDDCGGCFCMRKWFLLV